jgi:pyruvate/2-oxoglutarate dehydrogenase complex dihydrolipoamide acyltransferase (E2) component
MVNHVPFTPANIEDFHILPMPAARRLVMDSGRLGSRRLLLHGLVEFDVTKAREFIRQYKAETGETLSFTGFLAGCLAQAVAANPHLHAYRDWRNRLVAFDDVDVVILVEPAAGAYAFPHIIRAANRKSFRAIHDEIRSVQAQPEKSAQQSGTFARLGLLLPGFVRDLFYRALLLNPHWLKQYTGTVVITAVGMFGKGGGWGLFTTPFHTLQLTVGGIAEKPALVDGQLVLHEYLCLTLTIDHLVVDGAPAARFTQCFKELVESGYGLC